MERKGETHLTFADGATSNTTTILNERYQVTRRTPVQDMAANDSKIWINLVRRLTWYSAFVGRCFVWLARGVRRRGCNETSGFFTFLTWRLCFVPVYIGFVATRWTLAVCNNSELYLFIYFSLHHPPPITTNTNLDSIYITPFRGW